MPETGRPIFASIINLRVAQLDVIVNIICAKLEKQSPGYCVQEMITLTGNVQTLKLKLLPC